MPSSALSAGRGAAAALLLCGGLLGSVLEPAGREREQLRKRRDPDSR